MSEGNFKHILTLGNSIIGVSILAMPYCFKQCGMLLGIVLLIMSSYINRLNCHFLIKSAISTKRRSYEFLAFHIFGPVGKLAIEVIQIGFLFGIAVSFFVIAGDLGPKILAQLLDVPYNDNFRAVFLVGLCFLIVLPLSLLRNIDSLASMSAISLTFYVLLVLKIVADSWRHIVSGAWQSEVVYWRPGGFLQALPIMSLALACQTNVFSIYENVPDPSLSRMNTVVAGAINLCCGAYILVGFFGYVALHDIDFGGNILVHLQPSPISRWINIGFVMSIALGFPLIVYPCRISVNSLLFRRQPGSSLELPQNYIPETRFKCITFCILALAMSIGILIPSIEVVLGLLGSTMGTAIAILFPSVMFIKNTSRNSLEKMAAQIAFVLGIVLLICGTYVNLNTADQLVSEQPLLPKLAIQPSSVTAQPALTATNASQLKDAVALAADRAGPAISRTSKPPDVKADDKDTAPKPDVKTPPDEAVRQEPAEPQPPKEIAEKEGGEKEVDGAEKGKEKVVDGGGKEGEEKTKVKSSKLGKDQHSGDDAKETPYAAKGRSDVPDKPPDALEPAGKARATAGKKPESSGPGELDEGALLREAVEKRRDDALKPAAEKDNLEQKQEAVLQKLEETHKEQKELLKEQKQLLEEMKQQKQQQDQKQPAANQQVTNPAANQPAVLNQPADAAPNQAVPNQQAVPNIPALANPQAVPNQVVPNQPIVPNQVGSNPQAVPNQQQVAQNQEAVAGQVDPNHQNVGNVLQQAVNVLQVSQQQGDVQQPVPNQQLPVNQPAGAAVQQPMVQQPINQQLQPGQPLAANQQQPALQQQGLNYQQPLPMQQASIQHPVGGQQQGSLANQQLAGNAHLSQAQQAAINQPGVNQQQPVGSLQQSVAQPVGAQGNSLVGQQFQQQGVYPNSAQGAVGQQQGVAVPQQAGNLQQGNVVPQQVGNLQQGSVVPQQVGNLQQGVSAVPQPPAQAQAVYQSQQQSQQQQAAQNPPLVNQQQVGQQYRQQQAVPQYQQHVIQNQNVINGNQQQPAAAKPLADSGVVDSAVGSAGVVDLAAGSAGVVDPKLAVISHTGKQRAAQQEGLPKRRHVEAAGRVRREVSASDDEMLVRLADNWAAVEAAGASRGTR